jgi:D-alanyl-D-alanine carboxypeptidase
MIVTRPWRTPAALLLAFAIAGCGGNSGAPRPTQTAGPSATASTAPASPTATPAPSAPPIELPVLAPIPVSMLAPAAVASSIHRDDATEAALQKALDEARSSRQGAPALQAAVVFPDGSIWTGQSGVAIRSPSTAVARETLFSVGSISKTFVAALTLRLVERGTIGLDDLLSMYVPDYPNAGHITVRQLLSHTSGLRDLFTSPGMAADILADPDRVWTAQEVLARIGKPYFSPGKGWRYSNTNYVLMGLVIEKATGRTVAEQVREEFLEPLGLNHTFLQSEEKPAGMLSHGYSTKGKANTRAIDSATDMIPYNSEVTACGPAGAYASTADDLARWGSALYSGAVISHSSLAAMADVSISTQFKARPYGLGFEKWGLSGKWTWGHLGALDGYAASLKYLPDLHVTIVVLANSDGAKPTTASGALLAALLAAAD